MNNKIVSIFKEPVIMTNAQKGKLGEEFVRKRLLSEGFDIEDIKENGCDLIAKKGRRRIKIEVKTTSNLTGGIPDMHLTQFVLVKNKWLFIADYLYIVRLNKHGEPTQLDILSKKDIDSFSDSHRMVQRIRTTKLDRTLNNKKVGTSVTL